MEHDHNDQHDSMGHHDHHAHMVMDFRKRFWICLAITAPILLLSPMIREWLAVEPQEVVHGNQESGERGKVVEAGVGAMPVVMVEPG